MRFYVASGLENRELAADMVRFIAERGHMPIYDWTEHGDCLLYTSDNIMCNAAADFTDGKKGILMGIHIAGNSGLQKGN